ncbi:MAG: ADP-ribosylglycohydrolase family protein [Planctomycetales bacterium]|nr:ADP-ribosylglycohydrolase family protein [Planctomycetales bacterium]
MHSTSRRKDHLHGLLAGVAIGDALGFAREGLPRRRALKAFGRRVGFQLVPGYGFYSDDTQLLLLSAQSLLNSRSELSTYRRAFSSRLKWLPLSIPIGIGKATFRAAMRSWLIDFNVTPGVNSAGNGPATRAIFLALGLHGTGHRVSKWIEDSTSLTHTDPLCIDACRVLGEAAELAVAESENFNPHLALERIIKEARLPELKSKLVDLQPMLAAGKGPRAVARYFGWQDGISGFIVPTTVMALYCFLRYPKNYQRAVESAILLGGDSDSLGAIAGGLVGAHIGFKRLPQDLVIRLAGAPHGRSWIASLAERLSDWPHGYSDLFAAQGQPTRPVGQLLRNLFITAAVFTHVLLRKSRVK